MKKRTKRLFTLFVTTATLASQTIGVPVYAAEASGEIVAEAGTTEGEGDEAGSNAEAGATESGGDEAGSNAEAGATEGGGDEAGSNAEAGATEGEGDEAGSNAEAGATEGEGDEAGSNAEAETTEGDEKEKTLTENADLVQTYTVNESDLLNVEPGPTPDPNNQPDTSEGVNRKWTVDDRGKNIKIYYEITDGAEGDVVLNFSDIRDILNKWYQEKTGDPNAVYTTMPGDKKSIDIEVITSNGHTYRYKDGSFRMETASTIDMDQLTDLTGFDGQKLPMNFIGSISTAKPLLELYGLKKSTDVTINHVLNLKFYLERNLYFGETALTDYLRHYYNRTLKTNYATFEELAKEHPEAVANMQGKNGRHLEFELTEEQYNQLLEQYPDFMKEYSYICAKDDDGNYIINVKWPEQQVAAASYELFYKNLLNFAFGDEETRDAFLKLSKLNNSEHGVKDYMDDTNQIWSKVNDYLKEATEAGLNREDATKLAISMAFGLDGAWTTNAYQYYDYSWYNSITMEQVDGDVTINKVDENGNVIKDPAQFQLYFYKMELVNDKEEKVTYYYAVDENGNGYFTTDASKAALLITENGSYTVKYLLPDYTYYLTEIKAPDGYEISGDDISFTIVSKDNTVIDITNKLIVVPDPEPKPEPKPDPEPEPESEPTPTPNPEPTPEPEPVPTKTTKKHHSSKKDEPVVVNVETPTEPVEITVIPKTGDKSGGDTEFFVMTISMLGMVLVATKKKRTNQNN